VATSLEASSCSQIKGAAGKGMGGWFPGGTDARRNRLTGAFETWRDAEAEPSASCTGVEQQVRRYQHAYCQDQHSGCQRRPTNSGLTSDARQHLVSFLIERSVPLKFPVNH
jgi:hypothetical protein